MNQREAIIEQISQVPALPASAGKVINMIQRENVSVNELTQAIVLDPGLTTNMLRMANSPAFGATRVIGSVQEAIVRLGLNRVMELVMSTSVAPITMTEIKGYDLPPGELWERSAGTAFGSELVAKYLNIQPPPFTYTAGLLHDIGKIVLGTHIAVDPAPILALSDGEHIPFEEAELRVLGIDHAEVGALLLEAWQLPESIVQCTRYHHHPEKIEGDTLLADLVHVGSDLCTLCGIGVGVDGLNYRPSSTTADRLGLTNAVAEKTCMDIVERLCELREVFDSNRN